MNAKTPSYHGYRFPPEIVSHAVWLYYRFCLSFRDVEDLLAKRGVIVSHETIRQVIDILVQSRRNRHAAERFFRKLLKGQGSEPRRLVTDKLKSYSAAHRAVMPSVVHDTRRYANNRAEVSHQPTRQRERQMRRFKSAAQAQQFLSVHGVILNLFRVGRHLLRSANHRILRERSFLVWSEVTCA